jgi:ABC-type transport system involved in multi-copper enzyme maturation permease subunit
MTTLRAADGAPVARPGGDRVGFGSLVHAEWTKIRSVRSTVWSLVVMCVVCLGLTGAATASYMSGWDRLNPADRQHLLADPIGLVLQPAAIYGQIAICVFGVMAIASEYSTGMIRASLLAVPRRTRMLAAKATVAATLVFVVAELIAFPAFFLGQAVLRRHVPIAIGDPGMARAIVGFGLYLAVMALFALAVGAIVRHIAGAIAGTLGFVLVLSNLAGLLPGSLGQHVSAYLPGNAGQAIMSSGHDPGALLSPGRGSASCACGSRCCSSPQATYSTDATPERRVPAPAWRYSPPHRSRQPYHPAQRSPLPCCSGCWR